MSSKRHEQRRWGRSMACLGLVVLVSLSAVGYAQDNRVEKLINDLNDMYSDDQQEAAAEALGRIGDPRAVEPLIMALKDRDLAVRRKAAEALGKIKDARAVEPLIVAMKDENEYVRQEAAEALGKIGVPAVEALIITLKDKDSDIQENAIKALGWIGDARAVDPLIAALKDEDSDIREKAAQALRMIGDARAVKPLITVLKDKDLDVREEAVWALDEIGWEPSNEAEKFIYLISSRKWDELINIDIGQLIAAMKDKDRWVRRKAAEALGKIKDVRAVEPLIAALKVKYSPDVRWKAAEVLGKIKDARAVEPLIAALKDKGYIREQVKDGNAYEYYWKFPGGDWKPVLRGGGECPSESSMGFR